MATTKVIKFQNCFPEDDLSDTMVLCAVSPCFKEEFSYKRDTGTGEWYIDVRASTVDGLISVLHQCKRAIPMFGKQAQRG